MATSELTAPQSGRSFVSNLTARDGLDTDFTTFLRQRWSQQDPPAITYLRLITGGQEEICPVVTSQPHQTIFLTPQGQLGLHPTTCQEGQTITWYVPILARYHFERVIYALDQVLPALLNWLSEDH